jgi:hypothetical protein
VFHSPCLCSTCVLQPLLFLPSQTLHSTPSQIRIIPPAAFHVVDGIIFIVFVSLSMKFQASRFSASGREMPLEPHRSEACRSCQPMHVLSFGEGRKCLFVVAPSRISATSVWCMKRRTRWIFD